LEEDRAKRERFGAGFWDGGCSWERGFSASWDWVAIRERVGGKGKDGKGEEKRKEDEPEWRLAGPGRDDDDETEPRGQVIGCPRYVLSSHAQRQTAS
jgi:hypothetical protein